MHMVIEWICLQMGHFSQIFKFIRKSVIYAGSRDTGLWSEFLYSPEWGLGEYISCLSVSPSVLTNCVLYLNFMKLNIQWLTMMCKLQVGCSCPLRLPFGLQFDPIQYASCHHISSDNVWWVHLKVMIGRFTYMQMCMNRRYGPLNLEILNLSSMHLDIATPLTWYDGYTGKFVDC